jgi:hypothetical protein
MTVTPDLHFDVVNDIGSLRKALAYEAGGIVQHLTYPSFPKTPRPAAELLVQRMRSAARGERRAAAADEVESASNERDMLRAELLSAASALEGFLDYKTFPKPRRHVAVAQVARMREGATLNIQYVYAGRPSVAMQWALRDAGAAEFFTLESWQQEARS